MLKRLLFIFLFLSSFYSTCLVAAQYDYYSLDVDYIRLSRSLIDENSDSVGLVPDPVFKGWGAGVSYNDVRFSISQYEKGFRYAMSYRFFSDFVINPYLGVSYIHGSKKKYFYGDSEFKLDHIDALMGLNINFPVIKPFVEYDIISNVALVGVKIALDRKIKRKSYSSQ